jgi:ribose/xylose/arabinose/galactoside ABC-type transport system permease subunit
MNKVSNKIKFDLTKYTSLFGLVLLLIVSSVLSPAFLKPINILNIIRQIVPNGIVACGMTLVILTGGIDLSVGSLFALAGVSISLLLPIMPWPIAIVLLLIASVIIGYLVGMAITELNVPPFIMTLAGYAAYRGIAMAMTKAANIYISDRNFTTTLGSGRISGIYVFLGLAIFIIYSIYRFITVMRYLETAKWQEITKLVLTVSGSLYAAYLVKITGFLNVQILYYIVILLISMLLLNKTIWGRQIYAVGGNFKAAKMTGIRANVTVIKVYIFMTLLGTFAGILIAAKLQSGVPAVGVSAEFDAITAVVIGGTSLAGGVGKLQSTVIGVLLIGVLNNLLSLLNVSADYQNIFKGLIIFLAVVIDTKFKNR